jgi:RHS repeat-associated protein
VVFGAVVVTVGASLSVPAIRAVTGGWRPPQAQAQRSVPGRDVRPPAAAAAPPQKQWSPPATTTWPAARTAVVAVPAATAATAAGEHSGPTGTAAARPPMPGMPVSVAPPAGGGRPAGRVRIEILDRAATEAAGIQGVLLRAAAADSTVDGVFSLGVDYSGFRGAFGGDWAARLRVVRLPDCAVTTPEVTACRTGTPLPSRNDTRASTVTADVSTGSTGAVYALAAGAAGGTGNFGATSLSPSASWQVSAQTGAFSWSYPMRTPPAPAGPTPDLTLVYSSGSVDGRIASTNNQTSWVGEGFDMWPGYVERKYKGCGDDGVTPKPGDLCWAGEYDSLVLAGHSSQLVREGTSNVFHLREDDGTRVERLTGADNRDAGTDGVDGRGEYWKVTTTNGMQYFFGRNKMPGWAAGNPVTNSTWTVPVFGNNDGEPCHQATFAASSCVQAYRWNLDFVVDTHGNTLVNYYQLEQNRYGRNRSATDVVQYDRGGYLLRTEYGLRAGSEYASPPARVLYQVSERCVYGSAFNCDGAPTAGTASHWPDVPLDRDCPASPCKDDQLSPTFWSRKRLTKVTTQTLTAGVPTEIDSWTLNQSYPLAGDLMAPGLWLNSIVHSGSVGGAAISLPAVSFDPVELENRVDAIDGLAPMDKRRILAIHSEAGGLTSVSYSDHQCVRGSAMPASPETNTMRCYPIYWTPEGSINPTQDWFHKYVVTQVVQADNSMIGTPFDVTSYKYDVGGTAWHYDEDELKPANERTWSDFRGYGRVKVSHGDTDDQRTETEYLYFRGMDGDHLPSGTRDVKVTDSEGGVVDDHWRLAGTVRETIVHNGPDGPVVSGAIQDPWLSGPTASQGSRQAYRLNVSSVRNRVALAAGGWRRTQTTNTFDSIGMPIAVSDLGDTGTATDDRCTRYSYARNLGANILTPVSREETVAVACTATPVRPDQVISDVRSYYDNSTTVGAAPVRGDVTKSDKLASWSGGPVYVSTGRVVYDSLGRIKESYDGAENRTVTDYTPATGGPVTQVTTTNPLQHVTTTTLEPAWGQPKVVVDPNGKRTTVAYDQIGRLIKVWLPGRDTAASPSIQYAYRVIPGSPIIVRTDTLRNDGTYASSYELHDALLRPRQSQEPAPGGGRIVTDTEYNSRGLPAKASSPYFNDQAPGPNLFDPTDNQVPAQTVTTYDGVDRVTVSLFRAFGLDKWRTTTSYGGDRVSVDPPVGATATTTITDARGRTVELRQYHGGSATGDYDATRYTYGMTGQVATVTDAAGNVWRSDYDLLGRVKSKVDPDTGTSTMTYDGLDRLATSTDGQGKVLAYVYDALGRQTEVHETSVTGPKVATFVYDTIAKGQRTSATRWVGADAYTTAVTGYNDQYQPTGTSVTIPAVAANAAGAGTLAGTYTMSATYNVDGTVKTASMPQMGSLPAETLTYSYNELGMLSGLSSDLGTIYVNSVSYHKLGMPEQVRYGVDGKLVIRSYSYEEATNRLQRAQTDLQQQTNVRQADVTYAYDEAGNITSAANVPPASSAQPDVQCFTYDYLRRLTEAWSSGAPCAGTPTQSAVGGAAPYWESYTYDSTGNRKTQTKHAASGDVGLTYAYPAAGQPQPHTLTSVTQSGPTGSSISQFGYDATGNTSTRTIGGDTQQFDWDPVGHLASVAKGSDVTSYVYDADGNRLIRRDATALTLYVAGGELRLDRQTGAAKTTRYYGDGTGTVAVRTYEGKLFWQIDDQQGTAQVSIDASTLAVTRRWLTPFGEPRSTPVPWKGERGFVDGVMDSSTGLTHLGAREYDPGTGRFISPDPIIDAGDPQQMNGYAYANNNPVSFNDAAGLRACGPDGVWCGADPNYDTKGHHTGPQHAPPQLMYLEDPDTPSGGSGRRHFDPVIASGHTHDEYRRAIKAKQKKMIEVVLEAGGDVLKEFLGINDIEGCFGGHDLGACISMVVGAIPWTKMFKVGKLVGAAKRAWGAVRAFLKELKHADEILTDVGKAALHEGDEVAKVAGSCLTHSFRPDTRVRMADGSTKPIGDVRLGDRVLATDPTTGRTEVHTVVALHVNNDHALVDLKVRDGHGGVAMIHTTELHPIWADRTHGWVNAGALVTGDTLRADDDTAAVQVVEVHRYLAAAVMRDLTVDGVHTYYVIAGTTPVLVHNCSEELANLADANIGQTNVASEVTNAHGAKGYGTSQRRAAEDLPPSVRNAVNATGHHGGCAEIGALCDLADQGQPLTGLTADSVKVAGGSRGYPPEAHLEPVPMCSACTRVFDYLNER